MVGFTPAPSPAPHGGTGSVNGQTADGSGNIDLDYETIPVAGTGNGVTNVTHDLLAALSGAPQVDFTDDSDFDMAGGATLRSTGIGPGKFVSRAYPYGGSPNLVTHVHVTAAFHAVTSTFVSLALFRPDGTTIPLSAPVGSGLGGSWDVDEIDVRFFGTGTESIDIDIVLAVPEQFDEDDIQLGISEASFASGDPVTMAADADWFTNVADSVDRFASHTALALLLGQLPITTFYAKFGPFASTDMSASGDGSYAESVGNMTDSRGGTHWTVVDGDEFFQYNQAGDIPDFNGLYTFHRPASGDCYFTYNLTQPTRGGTLVILEQGGDPIPGLDPAQMQQGGTVPGTGLEQQVGYYIRAVSYNNGHPGFDLNQIFPNPSLMWTYVDAEGTFDDSRMVWFLNADALLHLRAPDFSDGANVVQRIYYLQCIGAPGTHATVDTHQIESIDNFEIPGGSGILIYSDGTNWRLLLHGLPIPPPSGTYVLSSVDGEIAWAESII